MFTRTLRNGRFNPMRYGVVVSKALSILAAPSRIIRQHQAAKKPRIAEIGEVADTANVPIRSQFQFELLKPANKPHF